MRERRLTKKRLALLIGLVLGVCVYPGVRTVTAIRALDLASQTDAGPRLLDCLVAGSEGCNDKDYQGVELQLDGERAFAARGGRAPIYGDLWLQVGDERLHCYSVVAEARQISFVPGWISGADEIQSSDPRCTEALVKSYAQ